MATPGIAMVSPRLAFMDDAGPVGGGSVEVFKAGTAVHATTYTDRALTIPNSNPIDLDAFGGCTMWGTIAQALDLQVFDSLGAPLYTIENVNAWTVHDVVNVENYPGCFPNSGTDSTAAFQAAVDALPALGGEVYCPSQNYTVVGPVNVGAKDVLWHTNHVNGNDGDVTLSGSFLSGHVGLIRRTLGPAGGAFAYLAVHNGKSLTRTNGADMTDSVPGTALFQGWTARIKNNTLFNLTLISAGPALIDGVASVILYPGQTMNVWSNGTDYQTSLGGSSGVLAHGDLNTAGDTLITLPASALLCKSLRLDIIGLEAANFFSARLTFNADTGAHYNYSNTRFDLTGAAVVNAAGIAATSVNMADPVVSIKSSAVTPNPVCFTLRIPQPAEATIKGFTFESTPYVEQSANHVVQSSGSGQWVPAVLAALASIGLHLENAGTINATAGTWQLVGER